ncbi:MAG TPA: PTS fructose transporter subunit IIA [Gammaproteobacteria bacterium]
MAVGVLLVTHGELGAELLRIASAIMGEPPLPCAAVSVAQDRDPEQAHAELGARLAGLEQGDGVLVLVDLFGATPCNVVRLLPDAHPCALVTGANLPMLLRVFNYPDLDLPGLVEKALGGGRDGVQRISDLEF